MPFWSSPLYLKCGTFHELFLNSTLTTHWANRGLLFPSYGLLESAKIGAMSNAFPQQTESILVKVWIIRFSNKFHFYGLLKTSLTTSPFQRNHLSAAVYIILRRSYPVSTMPLARRVVYTLWRRWLECGSEYSLGTRKADRELWTDILFVRYRVNYVGRNCTRTEDALGYSTPHLRGRISSHRPGKDSITGEIEVTEITTSPPDLQFRQGSNCLSDFFTGKRYSCPDAIVFVQKDGVYSTHHVWNSIYNAESGIGDKLNYSKRLGTFWILYILRVGFAPSPFLPDFIIVSSDSWFLWHIGTPRRYNR